MIRCKPTGPSEAKRRVEPMFAGNLRHHLAGFVDLVVDAATLGEYGFEQDGEHVAAPSCSTGSEGRHHHGHRAPRPADRAHEQLAA